MYPHCEHVFGAKYSHEDVGKGCGALDGLTVCVFHKNSGGWLLFEKSACDEIERICEENESIKGRMLKVAKEGWKL